ncbi:hypothetical protein TR631_38100 [Streptomyces rochei]|uniref:hypothetical protein n=1 Tax=Streptomyces rochei TaxID=1928 RepID=UPI002ACE5D6E|nr:hypothetical protein [Streptomyces rochei]WQC10343.1 hypothetical protein TR631_00210 [Streptomyces rochei]WQC17332.1 hypothetical protein TR631_38100 [Streptomyces rochei]
MTTRTTNLRLLKPLRPVPAAATEAATPAAEEAPSVSSSWKTSFKKHGVSARTCGGHPAGLVDKTDA